MQQVKKDLYVLFGLADPQKRGKQVEGVLNRLFQTTGILLREAFTCRNDRRGCRRAN